MDTLFVAANPTLMGDPRLGEDAPSRFLPSHFTPAGDAIDPSGETAHLTACPRCHLEFPSILLERMPLILSLAGMPSSGKTYFLASAMWHLRQLMPVTFGVTFQDADALLNRPLSANEEKLFLSDSPDKRVALEKTQLEGGHTSSVEFDRGIRTTLPKPFLFTLRPRPEHVNGAKRDALTFVFCLYDNAGEHYLPGADSVVTPGTKHIAAASVVMFMYDPLQDVRFRTMLRGVSHDPQLEMPIRGMRQDTLITELVTRIRAHAALPSTGRVKRPLLLLVSKSDSWGHLLNGIDIHTEPYTPIDDESRVGRIDIDRVDAVSDAVRNLLLSHTPELVAAAEDGFERVIYMPVSATGAAPSLDGESGMLKIAPRQLKPHWVTVPFIYALARWSQHFIGGNREAADGITELPGSTDLDGAAGSPDLDPNEGQE
ncbi:MAG: hypothetical protein O2800_01435 [Planctomycetota bacterium]|nr:hypothetical protein [Planctomycetota bacterium]